MDFVWNSQIFLFDHVKPTFPEEILSQLLPPDTGTAFSATLMGHYDSSKTLKVLGHSSPFFPGLPKKATVISPVKEGFQAAISDIFQRIGPTDVRKLEELLYFNSMETKDFDIVFSLLSPVSGRNKVRVTYSKVNSCTVLFILSLTKVDHPPELNLAPVHSALEILLEERDMELVMRSIIPVLTHKNVVDFPGELEFHRHARTMNANLVKSAERLYSVGSSIGYVQRTIESTDDEHFRLRARISGIDRKKSETLIRGLQGNSLREIDLLANSIQIDIGIYVAGIDRIGAVSVPMPTIRKHKPNHFFTIVKRSSLNLPKLPFVSDFFRYTKFWDPELRGMDISGGMGVCGKFGVPPQQLYVVPIWDISDAHVRRRVFERQRMNDPLLVDRNGDIGMLVLRGYDPEKVSQSLSIVADLRKLGVSALDPEPLSETLDRL